MRNTESSTLSLLPEPSDGAPDCHSSSSIECVGTSSFYFAAVFATPDSNSLSLHRILATKFAEVFAVLTDLHLLNLLSQTSTISRSILPDDASLGSLCHVSGCGRGGAKTLETLVDLSSPMLGGLKLNE